MPEREDDWPTPEVPRPPTEDELPCCDGMPMETERHREQMNLLIEPLYRGYWAERDDVYVGGNMFLYFSETQSKKNDFRGPDVFVVLNTRRRYRKSWVVWGEDGRVPDVIIELVSESTAQEDRTRKKQVYEHLRVPTYVIYDPFSADFEAYRLDATGHYEPVAVVEQRLHLPDLCLDLAVWHGDHGGEEAPWLRWHLPDGPPLPSALERADGAQQQAAAAQEAAAAAQEAAAAAQEAAAAAQEAATAERRRAEELSARVAELERRLAEQGG